MIPFLTALPVTTPVLHFFLMRRMNTHYVEYAYRAGYNPHGLRDYLQTLENEKGQVESKFFTTHPSTSRRITKIDTLLRDYSDIKNLPFLADHFHQYVKAG